MWKKSKRKEKTNLIKWVFHFPSETDIQFSSPQQGYTEQPAHQRQRWRNKCTRWSAQGKTKCKKNSKQNKLFHTATQTYMHASAPILILLSCHPAIIPPYPPFGSEGNMEKCCEKLIYCSILMLLCILLLQTREPGTYP